MSSPVLGKNSPGGGSNAAHGMPGVPDMYGGVSDMYGGRMFNPKANKEANLMPVPSPQQIQFPLLDGQELTIQKQPNTSLRDSDIPDNPLGHDPSTPGGGGDSLKNPGTGGGGPHTPTSEALFSGDHTPGGGPLPGTPHTPTSSSQQQQDSNKRAFPAPSPGPDGNPRFPMPGSPGVGRFHGGMSPNHMAMVGAGLPPQDNMPLT